MKKAFTLFLILCFSLTAIADIDVSFTSPPALRTEQFNDFTYSMDCNKDGDYLIEGDITDFLIFVCVNSVCEPAVKETFIFTIPCEQYTNRQFSISVPKIINGTDVNKVELAWVAKRFDESIFPLNGVELFEFVPTEEEGELDLKQPESKDLFLFGAIILFVLGIISVAIRFYWGGLLILLAIPLLLYSIL